MSQRYEELGARLFKRLGNAMLNIDRLVEGYGAEGLKLRDIRVRLSENGREALVIVKVSDGQNMLVGFHSASEASDALAGAMEKVINGQMVFREDRPYPG